MEKIKDLLENIPCSIDERPKEVDAVRIRRGTKEIGVQCPKCLRVTIYPHWALAKKDCMFCGKFD